MASVQVWVGCMAHYNNGDLIGQWVDATDAPDWKCPRYNPNDVYINCEETWIYDHEIPGVKGEMSPTTAGQWGEAFADLDDDAVDAFAAYLKHAETDDDPSAENLIGKFKEAFRGAWDSERDFAMQEFEEMYGDVVDEMIDTHHYGRPYRRVPEVFTEHFDWDSYTESIFQHGDYTLVDGYVFMDDHG